MFAQGIGDLFRRKDQSSRRMKGQIDGHIIVGQFDRPEDLFRILNIDVAGNWESKQGQRFLAMDEYDRSTITLLLQGSNHSPAGRLEHLLSNDGLHRSDDEKYQKDGAEFHSQTSSWILSSGQLDGINTNGLKGCHSKSHNYQG
jgi:hypothetical protein